MAAYVIEAAVSNAETKTEGSKTFTVYVIDVRRGPALHVIHHRYSEFNSLHAKLKKRGVAEAISPLPPKKWFGNMKPAFVERRRLALHEYLQRVVACTPMPDELYVFLQIPLLELKERSLKAELQTKEEMSAVDRAKAAHQSKRDAAEKEAKTAETEREEEEDAGAGTTLLANITVDEVNEELKNNETKNGVGPGENDPKEGDVEAEAVALEENVADESAHLSRGDADDVTVEESEPKEEHVEDDFFASVVTYEMKTAHEVSCLGMSILAQVEVIDGLDLSQQVTPARLCTVCSGDGSLSHCANCGDGWHVMCQPARPTAVCDACSVVVQAKLEEVHVAVTARIDVLRGLAASSA